MNIFFCSKLTHQLRVDLGDNRVLIEERGDLLRASPEVEPLQEGGEALALLLGNVLCVVRETKTPPTKAASQNKK